MPPARIRLVAYIAALLLAVYGRFGKVVPPEVLARECPQFEIQSIGTHFSQSSTSTPTPSPSPDVLLPTSSSPFPPNSSSRTYSHPNHYWKSTVNVPHCCSYGCDHGLHWDAQDTPSKHKTGSCGHHQIQKGFNSDDCSSLRPPSSTYWFPPTASTESAPKQMLLSSLAFTPPELALRFINDTMETSMGISVDKEAFVVDYTYRGSELMGLVAIAPLWTFLFAYLPPPSAVDYPHNLASLNHSMPPNVILWNRPSAFRLKALGTTLNFFDVQLLLRTDDLLSITSMTIDDLLGSVIPMAQRTLLILPCMLGELNQTQEEAIIRQSLDRMQGNKVGLQSLSVNLVALERFMASQCQRTLWRVEVLSIRKGVKHMWCQADSPWRHKFDFIWSIGQPIGLAITNGIHLGKVRWLRHWIPCINYAELLAWGVLPNQRLLLFADTLNFGSYPDAGISNWLLGGAGRAIRIDWDNPFMTVLKGPKYLPALGAQMCFAYPPPFPTTSCPCCLTCQNHDWGDHPPDESCHGCYLCLRELLWPTLTPAALHEATKTRDGSIALECSQNKHHAFSKGVKYSCWSYTAEYEHKIIADYLEQRALLRGARRP